MQVSWLFFCLCRLLISSIPSVVNAQGPDALPDVLHNGWIYDHSTPYREGVNQRGAIRCVGRREPYIIPFSFQGVSVLEFCAAYDYGGRREDLMNENDPGVFCGYHFNQPRVTVFRPPGSSMWRFDWADEFKIWTYCQTKCKCVRPSPGLQSEREIIDGNRSLRKGVPRRHSLYVVNNIGPFGRLSWWTSSMWTIGRILRGRSNNGVRHPIPTLEWDRLSGGRGSAQDRLQQTTKWMVSGVRENALYCVGNLPPWIEGIRHEYSSVHHLCAANFQGGHMIANMGGVCSDPFFGGMSFGQAFAHPSLGWEVFDRRTGLTGQLMWSATLWCLSHCACNFNPTDMKNKWRITTEIANYGNILIGDGGEVSVVRSDRTGNIKAFTYKDATGGENCLPRRREREETWCFNPIPEDFDPAKLIPQLSFEPASPVPPPPGSCGSSCESNQDCSRRAGVFVDGEPCRCIASPVRETLSTIANGAAQVGFAAVCGIAVGPGRQGLATLKGLSFGKRSDPDQQPDPQAQFCACNATYVSAGCCSSLSGLVWEESAYKMGELV